jgi:hypothetical protein
MVKRKNEKGISRKKLHKGKKLEARKPLDVPVTHAATSSSGPTESISFSYGATNWQYSK